MVLRGLQALDPIEPIQKDDWSWEQSFGFGLTCLFLDLVCGGAFFILLKQKDRKLPQDERVMTFCLSLLFWFISIITSFICGFCFFLMASQEINERLIRIDQQNRNSIPAFALAQSTIQPGANGSHGTYSNPQPIHLPVADAVPVTLPERQITYT